MEYVSLHNHTASSNIRFLDCINRPEEMVNRAIELGYRGIAFTDHESLSAAVSILKVRDKIKDTNPDFKIIFGNEIYLIDDNNIGNNPQYYHFILLAKDEIGWKQLRTLSSRAWERGYVEKGIMRVPTTYKDLEEVIQSNPGHIIGSTACLGGELPNMILKHDITRTNSFIRWCISVFGADNFCLEIQPSDSEEQIKVNRVIVDLASHYHLKYIVTTDSHYLLKEDFKIHSYYLNSKQSSDRETEKFYRYTYLMSEEEIVSLLKLSNLNDDEIKEAFYNTCVVSDAIGTYDFRHSTIVPAPTPPPFKVRHLLKDWYDKYGAIKFYAYSEKEQDRYLMYQIESGIINKHIVIDDHKAERINTELDILLYITKQIKQDLSSYLNLTANIVDLAWQVSLIGCGRGSSCGFYINYLIGITQVDPLVYDLPEWRFLNKERAELPDVDADFQPEKTQAIIDLLRKEYGADNVLNCATFKTESLKSAILTVARGMGINNDDAQALAAMVPAHRGMNYTLKECLEGDEEKGFEAVPGFRNKLDQYPGLLEAVKKIEGLQSNSSIHASALYIFNEGYLAHNSLMRAPNKTKITAFNMHDSDDMGALKMDVLRTDAQSKMAKCLDLLLKDKQIEWQGDLRSTYNKYIHPDVLDYDNPVMWENAALGKISNLFQFETQVGSVCIKKAKPTNVMQLAEINSIMRLQVEGSEQPIDRYVKFREDINLWYLEMVEEGLNKQEIKVLEKYLLGSFGISGSQEVLMRILMDPQICNFTLGEANMARKAIAKKQAQKLIQLKKDFYSKGVNTRKEFLDYIWKYCIEPQLGYSFSLNHTLPYSIIAVQEMNLATRWNPLYWACACLCVNSGNSETEFDSGDELIPEDTNNALEGEKEAKTAKRVPPNYGKIAKAISDAQLQGVTIELPDINKAQVDFVPDIPNNSILYSLKAVNVVSDELLDRIMANRPYTSVRDFYERVAPTQVQMIGLIKAGCFDSLCKEDRKLIMEKFLYMLAEIEFPIKDKITTVNLRKALDLGLDLAGYDKEIKMYKYKKYIDTHQFDPTNRRYVLDDESCIRFFEKNIKGQLNISKSEYGYLPDDKIFIKATAFDKIYKASIAQLMDYLNSDLGKKAFQKIEQDSFVSQLKEKYCQGTKATWEMDTMSFYHEPHELKGINGIKYNLKNFNQLPEIPKTTKTNVNGVERENYNLCAIAGTVTDSNNSRHTVTLLTKDGIVDVKMYSTMYNDFNKKISTIDKKTNKKTVLDDSWFLRGTKLIVHGYRRENMFHAKYEYENGYRRCVGNINNINADGSISVKYSRGGK